MVNLLSVGPITVISPFPDTTITRPINPFLRRGRFGGFSRHKPFLRGSLGVARLGLGQVPFPDPEGAEGFARDLYGRAEGLLYTLADAAVSASSDSVANTKQSNDWLSGIANYMEAVLKVFKDGLSTLHVPYAYGFAIMLLTILVKTATFPLTKRQVESAMAMRSLQPQIQAIQQRYAGDQERIQLETARLYKLAGINPLAGCLPTLATIPVWIGLYRALSNVADEGLLTEGFFWIPSLAGPTTIAARQNGSGITWLFPFVDGHPPLGWSDTLAYLVLPVLLVVSQYISVQIMQSSQSNDPKVKNSQAITRFLPLMIGYFALSVPSGLSLYWFTNNILSTAQQVWLQKMGGANNPAKQVRNEIVRKDPPKIQDMLFKTTTIEEAPTKEKSTSEGLRPGERFKQIKEQEARRRRQREEEKRKAEEAAAVKETSSTTGGIKKEADLVEREDKNGAVSLGDNYETTNDSISGGDLHVVNGNFTPYFAPDCEASVSDTEGSEVSVNYSNTSDRLHPHEGPEKETRVTAARKEHHDASE